MKPAEYLIGRECRLDLTQPRIMGILNVTPDSFSDGGCYQGPEAALRQALRMQQEGADLLDIGGESTRPGASRISVDEELDRVVPIVELLSREIDLPLSIDTTKSEVAREALAAGGHFINDISGLTFDDQMAGVAAESGAGLFVMHTRGRPDVMQNDTAHANLLDEVIAYLRKSAELALVAGVPPDHLAIDPGIGFGKSVTGNLELMQQLSRFHQLGYPILLGTSRKSFIGAILEQNDPRKRDAGTLATVVLGVQQGVQIYRVHDVASASQAAKVAWAIRECRLP